MADNETLNLLPRSARVEDTSADFPFLVFVGFQLTWDARIADLESNTDLAKRWEAEFSHWHIDERKVHLCRAEQGYSLELEDGKATLAVFRPDAHLASAREHLAVLWNQLAESRQRLRIMSEVQYLTPVDRAEFAPEMNAVGDRLFRPEFLEALGASLVDFAFVADISVDDQKFTTTIGVLRASEVGSRVASAHRLPSIPNVSRFHSLRAHGTLTEGFSLDGFVQRLFSVGNNITHQVRHA